MKARILLAVAVFVGVTLAAPVPFVKEKKKKNEIKGEEALQGLWVVKSRERAGGAGAMKVPPTQQYVRIDGKTWTFGRDDGMGGFQAATVNYTIRLDTSKAPVWLDLDRSRPAFGKAGGIGGAKAGGKAGFGKRGGPNLLVSTYMSGLVEVSGDTIRFAYTLGGGDRPADFKLGGPREYLITLERVKKP